MQLKVLSSKVGSEDFGTKARLSENRTLKTENNRAFPKALFYESLS